MLADVRRRFARNRLAVAGGLVLAVYVLTAIVAPWISPHDPFAMEAERMLGAPGAAHWLGTDPFGRDILSRVLHGGRISLSVAGVAVAIALVAGTLMGLVAGFFGRWLDTALSRLTDMMFSLPDIVLALAIMAILGPNMTNLMIAIGIVYTPIFARVSRAAALGIKKTDYVDSARAAGVPAAAILRRHVVPNALAPIIVQATLCLAFAVLAEAALSFLGLGVEPDAPSWGIMLREGKDWMQQAWWVAVFPGLAITVAVLSFNLVGDGLRDALDPKS